MHKRILVVVVLMLVSASFLFADDIFVDSGLYPANKRQTLNEQLNITEYQTEPKSNSALLAIANPDYPVTPGDVYTLTYYDAEISSSSRLLSQKLQVDSQYNVNVPFLGKINAKGLTYIEFKNKIEANFSANYSYLRAQLDLTSCGTFEVYVYGEVNSTLNAKCWSMTRLSDLCQYATRYASTRDVYITYSNGKTYTYDLYAALKHGQKENNPFLQPGCKVMFLEAEKTVFVSGAVKHPGQYQINSDDTISSVIDNYAGGFDFAANQTYVTVVNFNSGKYESNRVEDFDSYKIFDMDSIYVSSLQEAKSFVTIQGAIKTDSGNSQGGKINYQFVEGETAEQLVRTIKTSFLNNSDTSAIYLLRDGRKYSVDTNLAFSTTECGETVLIQGDTIVIPYLQQYVTVAGGVSKPGNYTYEPDKDVDYYVNLAGGFSTDAKESSLKLMDSDGNILNRQSSVLPNFTISVKRRNTNAASAITLGISLATLGIAIYEIVK